MSARLIRMTATLWVPAEDIVQAKRVGSHVEVRLRGTHPEYVLDVVDESGEVWNEIDLSFAGDPVEQSA